MAVEGQLGFSANARNLEYIIRKLKHNSLAEVRELSQKLYDKAKRVCPSLIILSDPKAFKKQFKTEVSEEFLKNLRERGANLTEQTFSDYTGEELKELTSRSFPRSKGDVKLVYSERDADEKIIAALLHTHSKKSHAECYAVAKQMNPNSKIKFVKELLPDLTMFDGLPREFEYSSLDFEVVLSSSAFAQMKRHRPMTMTAQQYDPDLGCTYPKSVIETGQKDSLKEILDKSSEAYRSIADKNPVAAQYVLTNAHRRKVLINADLRELYHIARLRMDGHAQWDIRKIAGDMISLTKLVAPATAILACGKDQFEETRENVYR
jgi:thymidylate synthase ThyX